MPLWIFLASLAWGLSEMPYDGIDQDGDGVDWTDVDGDGWDSELAFGRDCNDRDDRVHPGARDRRGDGVDTDCDGSDGAVGERGCGKTSTALLGMVALAGVGRRRSSWR